MKTIIALELDLLVFPGVRCDLCNTHYKYYPISNEYPYQKKDIHVDGVIQVHCIHCNKLHGKFTDLRCSPTYYNDDEDEVDDDNGDGNNNNNVAMIELVD